VEMSEGPVGEGAQPENVHPETRTINIYRESLISQRLAEACNNVCGGGAEASGGNRNVGGYVL